MKTALRKPKKTTPKKTAKKTAPKKKAVPKKKAAPKKKKAVPKKKAAPKKKPAPKKNEQEKAATRGPFDMDAFVRSARAALEAKIEIAKREFGLGHYERFNLDQTRSVMEFWNKGEVRLRAEAQVVGSFSIASETWLWSWANASILPKVKRSLAVVRQFGKERHIAPLTESQWAATEGDGWSMAAVAAEIVGAQCAYRIPTSSGAVFVLLNDLTKV